MTVTIDKSSLDVERTICSFGMPSMEVSMG